MACARCTGAVGLLGRDAERLQARERPWQLAVGKLMRDAERAMADNWAQVERAAEDAAADRHATNHERQALTPGPSP